MVFSSIPSYLDPSNWQQNHQIIGNTSTNTLLPPPGQSTLSPPPHGVGGAGSIRPGSMAERARLANMPMPEAALRCPRCDSTNTKFCYFNNYSLTQPRHFCKTCRRYWTKGGALRNVPVGGGCRRNRRSKSSSSKPPATTDKQNSSSNGAAATLTPQLPPLRFASPLSQLTDNFATEMGLNYNGISAPVVRTTEMNFPGGGGGGGIEPWRLQQFPFMEPPPVGMYPFQGGELGFVGGDQGGGGCSHHVRPKFFSSMLNQLTSVKMEGNPSEEMNLSRQLLGGGMATGNDQWNTNAAWTDLSSFSSSSTSNPM